MMRIPLFFNILLLSNILPAANSEPYRESFSDAQLPLKTVGRGACTIAGGFLLAQNAYACFGSPEAADYAIQFRAQTPEGEEQVQIWSGFRAYNRFDRYIFGMKGGLSDELYLSRMGYMGKDELLAVRNLDFHPETGVWYAFRINVCGNRIQIFLNDEALPRIDVTDRNAHLAPSGTVTLGGGWLPTRFDDLILTPLPADYLSGVERKEYTFGITAREKEEKRKKERAGYQPVRVPDLSPNRTTIGLDGQWLFKPAYEVSDEPALLQTDNDTDWHILNVPDFWNPIRIWLHGETFGPFPKGVSDKYYRRETERCENYTFDY
ncbi:MAG: DUF1080 domain-containing protein, partial [Dysgonamonadaceae bacterium]|nr:DUF1080 domain-containing protein [Dysgonamonadaceae bacterium]